jgi:PAS domain S-box-containing protein
MTLPAVDLDHGLLDALFAQAPVGLAFWDADLRCVRANRALARLTGVPVAEHLGRRVPEVLPEIGDRLAELLQATLSTARPRSDVELSGRLPADPGTTHHWLASTYAVPGDPVRVGAVITDVTQRKRVEKEHRRLLLLAREARERAEHAERRYAFLAEAGKLLAGSLDYRVTLASIVRLAVPELADWCALEMVGPGGSVRRLASAAVDPEREARIARYERRYPLDPSAPWGSARVIRTGEPFAVERPAPGELEAAVPDPEQLAMLRAIGFESVMAVALRARGRILGALVLGSAGSGRAFDGEAVETAQELADRCALAVDNALLYEGRGISGPG